MNRNELETPMTLRLPMDVNPDDWQDVAEGEDVFGDEVRFGGVTVSGEGDASVGGGAE
jgi:hypothetical protein